MGVALAAPFLVLGGAIAHAAETAPATAVSVSVSGSGPGAPAGDPTSTTSSAPVTPGGGAVVDAGATASGEPGASVQQTIGVSVLPGSLTVSPGAESVTLSQVDLLGQALPVYRGELAPVTVVDARGSLVGWRRATVTLQSVAGADAALLADARVCAGAPGPTMVAGNPSDVVQGEARSSAGIGQPVSVFWAAPGGGGGTYRDTATLTVLVGNGSLPAHVTASLAVAVG